MIGFIGGFVGLCFLPLSPGLEEEPLVRCGAPTHSSKARPLKRCVQLDVSSRDEPSICSAFLEREIGGLRESDWANATNDCVVSQGFLVCRCDDCGIDDILNSTKEVSDLEEIHDVLRRCTSTEAGGVDESQTSTSEAAENTTKSGVTSKLKFSVSLESADNTENDTSAVTYPPPPDPVYYSILIEDVVVPYNNTPSLVDDEDDGVIQGKRYVMTPSHYYDPRRQEQIYGSSSMVLLMLNISLFLGTIVFFRAVLVATLNSIFPDYRMLN
uniref:Uncharacterized protein n=1 Tax=Haemonchus contortus TaxID=6289 RepID=A0A7I5EB89_HAECO